MKINHNHLINNKDQLKQVCAGRNPGKGTKPKQQKMAIYYLAVTVIPDEL
ncbi:hypothetical protein N473_18285 [Pseudoalteromonas luteoviolacea CPMOR-1]|uniref:Uncharacterized protein n=2 Tax=Pseudoalteromonas luteoviolacea TaxID=43657 RepID=A0A161YMG3_9GAMM|nr:hypothetical protein N473_18285 [Pseudoalteromonas luteoviolacea CPMOR-1]